MAFRWGPFAASALLAGALVFGLLVRYLPEVFLVLLLVSGALSSTIYADLLSVSQSLPTVSWTSLALLGIVASVAYHGWRRRRTIFTLPRGVVPFLLLAALLFAASFHSPDPTGALSKSVTFETVTAIAFLAPILLIDGRRSLIRFTALVAGLGVIVALLAVPTDHPARPIVLPGSDNEIVVGQLTGLALVAVVAALWPLTPMPWRLFWLVPSAIVIPPFVGAGSRGALLGTMVALLVALGLLLARRQTRMAAAAVVIGLALAAPTIWAASPPAAKEKYISTLSVGQASEALDAGGGQRTEILDSAVDLFAANPMGVGTNGYPALTDFEWPHNIVLELGAELGVVGIALYLALMVAVARALARAYRAGGPEVVGVIGFVVLTAILSMSSFDLNNNRNMWLMLGVALAVGHYVPRQPRHVPSRPAVVVGPSGGRWRPAAAEPAGAPAAAADGARREPTSLAAGGVRTLAFKGVEAALGVVLVAVTARFMEPSGRGLFALASFAGLLCVLPFGPVWSASAMEVARRRTPTPQLLGALATIAVVGGLASAAVAAALVPLLGQSWWVIAFPAAITPFLLLARYEEGLFQALGQIPAINWINVSRAALPVIFMTAPLAIGVSDQVAVALWCISLSLLPLLFLPTSLRFAGGLARPRERDLIPRLLRNGGRLVVANYTVLLNSRLGLLALAIFATTAAVGVYSVAIAAAEVVYLTSFALMTSSFRRIGSGTPEESRRVTVRALRHALVLHAAACALIIPMLYVALPLVVGGGYGQVPLALLIMTPGLIAQGGFWMLHTYFTVQLGQPRLIVRVALVGLAVNAVCCLTLVPLLGLWGAAAAASLANVTSAALAMVAFGRVSGTRLSHLAPGRTEARDYRELISTSARSVRGRFGAPGGVSQ